MTYYNCARPNYFHNHYPRHRAILAGYISRFQGMWLYHLGNLERMKLSKLINRLGQLYDDNGHDNKDDGYNDNGDEDSIEIHFFQKLTT